MQRLGARNQTKVGRTVSGPVVGVIPSGLPKLTRTFSEQSPISAAAASTSTNSSSDVNPLKSDPDLQILLKRLDRIKKYKKFQGWKTKFLSRLEKFVYQEGMTPAQKACNDFDDLLKKFVKRTIQVTEFIDKGELSNTRKTVKAALALNEMCNPSLTTVVAELETLIPYSGQQEKKNGFSKFHLGCGLIRQNFHQYITMKVIEDALTEISQKADDVADRQQHELMDKYKVQVQRFCDIMADLGLYEVMMKCLSFSEEPEDESEGSELINIVIETHDGKMLNLEIEADENIKNLQEIIAPGCNIESDRQVLKFRGNVLVDNNNKALEDFGIEDGSILTVEPFKIPITVKCSDGKVIQTMVDPTNKLGALKDQLQNESGIPSNNQKLSFNGGALKSDNETIDFYGIKADSILNLGPKTIRVTVVMPNGIDEHFVEINPLDKSDDIKTKIAKKTGMAVPKQVLTFNGEELPLLVSANDMGIQEGSRLQLTKVPITVTTMNGPEITVLVDPTAKLLDIKQQLEKESGITTDNQNLFLNGNVLDDDNKPAEDYGIQSGIELQLEPKSMKVQVEMPDGKVHTINVKPSDTIDDIKGKIQNETGMNVPRQVLKVNNGVVIGSNKPGQNNKTAKDMGIRDGTTIQVEVFKVPVTITTVDGQEIKAMVEPCAKLEDMKLQLEKVFG